MLDTKNIKCGLSIGLFRLYGNAKPYQQALWAVKNDDSYQRYLIYECGIYQLEW